jgi:hypothetical protein
MVRRFLFGALLFVAAGGLAHAQSVEVRGVEVPTQVELDGQTLVLNGAGVRQRLMFRVYVGSLYLKERTSDAEAAIAMDGPKRVQMNMLRNVDADTLREALSEGFSNNLSASELQALQPRIKRFESLIQSGKKGNEVQLDYRPGTGTEVRLNGEVQGVIEGEDFNRAVLGIWLGEKPADEGLKRGMLNR